MSHSSSVGRVVQLSAVILIVTGIWFVEEARGARRFFRNRQNGADLKKPFVLLYEHESFRGKEFVQYISKACVNLPSEYANWASSVDTHRTCASVCVTDNCAGPCHNVNIFKPRCQQASSDWVQR